MDTKKLRQKILDLAIHGKLVPQDPNDEPASVLLERIRKEKERLVKEGKIKKSKSSASSDKPPYENVPFELPKGWEWCKLKDIVQINGRIGFRGYTKDDLVEIDGAISLSPSNIVNGLMNFSKCTYISWEKYKESPEIIVNDGDILLVKTGSSYGKCALVKGLPKESTINPQFVVIKTLGNIDAQYVTYYLQSSYAVKRYEEFVLGTAIPTFTQVALGNMQIPLPSTVEQKHIVASVKLWTSLIDAIDSEETNIKQAIASAKSKILDLAIHGKLVPQNPNDEPAYAMLKKLGITSDNRPYENVPFEIPGSWSWCSLGDISNYGKCKTIDIDDIPSSTWILELEDIEKDTAKVIRKFTKNERQIKGVRHVFQKTDVLYSKLRTYLNKVLVAPSDGCCTTEIIPIKCFEGINSDFLCIVLRSPYFLAYTEQCCYGVKMPRLSTIDARKGLIPLPPLDEQIRIVSKVNELILQLENIEQSLQE